MESFAAKSSMKTTRSPLAAISRNIDNNVLSSCQAAAENGKVGTTVAVGEQSSLSEPKSKPKEEANDDMSLTETNSQVKRPKVTPVIVYPEDSVLNRLPSRAVVKEFYDAAMEREESEQITLTDAGLLSLEDVLLPAVVYQEDQILKQIQAKVKRDHPHLKPTVQACRHTLYESLSATRKAIQESRAHRNVQNEKREQMWAAERERIKQRQLEEQARYDAEAERMREMNRLKKKRELKKKFPQNQELWREVAYLMTEMGKLQKEERLWKEAEKELQKREDELKAQEEHLKASKDINSSQAITDTTQEEEEEIKEITEIEKAVNAITLSSVRIQQGLKIVSDIIGKSDKARKELYQRYRQDIQFHGYQGVKDPKGLIRALSQSQDVDYSD